MTDFTTADLPDMTGTSRMSTTARVLVVVSAADRIPLREGGAEPTGTHLGELTEPTDAMLEAGFELSFATPGGQTSPLLALPIGGATLAEI